MSNLRTRTSLQSFRAEFEAEEAAKQETAMRPVRQAEQALTNTMLAARAFDREAVLSDRPDPEFKLPQTLYGKRLSLADAQRFNTEQARAFVANCPEFYPSEKNRKAILSYLEAQKVAIADESTYRAAFERLRFLGLLDERPEPEPVEVQPEPVVDPSEAKRQALEKYHTEIIATDPRTGQELTAYMLDRLSAEDYRRIVFGEYAVPKVSDVVNAN